MGVVKDVEQLLRSEASKWPKEALVSLGAPHADERGAIQPLLDDMLMRSAVLITSKPGSVRANHYHKTGWHFCYVLEGEIEYFHRPTGSAAAPERLLVKPGQMMFTPPKVDHAMKFAKKTVFLTLDRNPRDQKTYEEDVVRLKLV